MLLVKNLTINMSGDPFKIAKAHLMGLNVHMQKTLIVRNKNAILELIQSGAEFDVITVIDGLEQDALTKKIISEASSKRIKIRTSPQHAMPKSRSGEAHDVIAGFLIMPEPQSFERVVRDLYKNDKPPFFLLLNKVTYANNIGSIARTAYAAGVNGLIFQGNFQDFLNEDTIHFSLGTIARLPLIKMSIFDALRQLEKEGIPSYALNMQGTLYYKQDLKGPAALVFGAEGEGLSKEVLERCTFKIMIPMQHGLDSLNVSTSAAIVLYEKIRQDMMTGV